MVSEMLQLKCAGHGPAVTNADSRKAAAITIVGSLVAAIAYYQDTLFGRLPGELRRLASDPQGQLLAIFDLRREAFERGDFTGCFAINAKVEFDGKHKGVETACVRYSRDLEGLIRGLCEQAGYVDGERIARQLTLLLEGTIIYAQIHRDASVAATARETAATILAAAEKGQRPAGRRKVTLAGRQAQAGARRTRRPR